MKKLFAVFLIPFLMILLTLPIRADERTSEDVLFDYGALIEQLPEAVREYLPDGLENETDEQSIADRFDGEYLASLCKDLLKDGIIAGLKLFASLLGLIIVCAILSHLASLFASGKTQIFDYAILLIAALELYGSLHSLFELTSGYISQINDYMTTISAAVGSIFLLTANVTTAAMGTVWLTLLLAVAEKLCHSLLFPLLQISFALTLTSSICPDMGLASVNRFIRQICTTLLVASMTLITVLMSFQTSIAAASDSVAMRGIKFAASNAIPIIGGLVSESMKTLATSLALVKRTAGLIGAIGLVICALIPLSILFTCRYSLSLSATVADLLQAASIKPLIEETGKLVGFLIGIVLIFSIFYLFTLSLLIHTASAIA